MAVFHDDQPSEEFEFVIIFRRDFSSRGEKSGPAAKEAGGGAALEGAANGG